LYEVTKNELQGSEMAISKKNDEGPQGHWFRKKSSIPRLQRWSWRCWCCSCKTNCVKKIKIASSSYLWFPLKLSTYWFKKLVMLNM